MRVVIPLTRSWTNTSVPLFVSPAAKFDAELSKATNRPSIEQRPEWESPSPWTPIEPRLTRCVEPVCAALTPASTIAATNGIADRGR
jgi:hypothetical protein